MTPPNPASHGETAFMRDMRRALSRGPVRLFRNNVGTGWAGGSQERRAILVKPDNLAAARAALRPGDAVVPNARPLHAGLDKGSGDLIGWHSIEITPAMVGQTVAVFASIETKATHGRVRPDQRSWLELVRRVGGLAGIARTMAEAEGILRGQP